MNEKTSNGTSGQNVPKSKFRHKSRQEQAAESKLRMEKRGEKLDKARGKLAKQKPPKRPAPVKRAGGRRWAVCMALCMGKSMRWSMKMWAPRALTAPSWWASLFCGMVRAM